MASEYNSNLISKLYQSTNEDEIINILKDMGEVGDAVFLHPILDGYEKHKDSFISHYFFSVLGNINSKDTSKYLNNLLENLDDIRMHQFPWILNAMTEIEYYTPSTIAKAKMFIEKCISHEFREIVSLNEIDIRFVLEYLKKTNAIDNCANVLRKLLFNKSLDREEKKTILSYLVRIEPKREIEYLIKNYIDKIKNTELELIVTKEFLGWKGKNVTQLKNFIIEHGQSRAKEILEKERKDIIKKENKSKEINQKEESIIYGNAKVILEIQNLRKQINKNMQLNQKFKLFPDNELLIQQTQCASNESSLVGSCINLRSIIQNINDEIENHGLEELDIKKLLPDVKEDDKKKSINQLYLFLNAKNIGADNIFSDFRLLNRVLSLLAHPENDKDLLKIVNKIGIKEMYNNQEWSKIHSHLLNYYKQILDKLNKVLK